jgi:membrane associated rhomboid family serine protease
VIVLLLTREQTSQILLLFAFIPGRYEPDWLAIANWSVGWGAAIWSFVTYAFIHGDLNHLIFNEVWLLAFGTPVARRFGPLRFMAFFALTAGAGAAVHLLVHFGEPLPMIGASAAISGAMAAAMRFIFQAGGPLGGGYTNDDNAYRVPAAPLAAMLREPRVLAFVAVWFGVNLLFGLGTVVMPGLEQQAIAWEAHIGGFVAGLLLFSACDPVRKNPPDTGWTAPPTAPTLH